MKEQLQFSYSDIQDTLTETPHSPCKNLLVTEVDIHLYQELNSTMQCPCCLQIKGSDFFKAQLFQKNPSVAVLGFDMQWFISFNRYSSIYCVNSGSFTV